MRYDENSAAVILTADELCRIAFGSGSLGHSSSSERSESARQKCRDEIAKGSPYFSSDAELTHTSAFFGIHYEVSAVADLIEKNGDDATLYMICTSHGKSSASLPTKEFTEKAICTAHFVCSKYELPKIKLRIIVYNIASGKMRTIESVHDSTELLRRYNICLSMIERYAKLCIAKETGGRSSVTAMKFPFRKPREGQKELIEEVFRAIHDGTRLLANAPTGIGKTISVLYPSVKALGLGLCDKVFYLTAKSGTRREAFSAIKRMFDAGAELKVIMLSAKEQMCACRGDLRGRMGRTNPCSPSICEYSRGYYDRVNDAVYELLSEYDGYTSKLIKQVAEKYRVCPYELSLDISEHCDVIICDYNYIFDPKVYLHRYFDPSGARNGENFVFLIDEAHNLADRAREMYSAELDLSDFENAFAYFANDGRMSSHLEEIIRAFRALKKLCADDLSVDTAGEEHGFYVSTSFIAGFSEKLTEFRDRALAWAKKNDDDTLSDILGELLFKINSYISLLDFYDEHFRTYILADGKNIRIKIFCIDPSGILDVCLARAVSSVLFSATLTPIDYFRDILGCGGRARQISVPSPFPKENLCLVAYTGAGVRHSVREGNISNIALAIATAVSAKKGNYMVYFPSYSYMDSVARIFINKFPSVETIIQSRGMSYAEKEEFLAFFKDDTDRMRIGFCVLGGSFSEGVDLPGSRLIGSIIVGVGMPQLSTELNMIRELYDLKYERGYAYAYAYPGINKVLQACGRVIRCETDVGVVVLIDDRYALPEYRELFPKHWENIKFASSHAELAREIKTFWQNNNKP